MRRTSQIEGAPVRRRWVATGAMILLGLACLGTPVQAQYARAEGLSAGRALSGTVLGIGVGVAAGLSVDVFRANVLEEYWEGEPTLANIGAHFSPWIFAGGVIGLVGIGIREEATAGHVWGQTMEAAGMAALGGGAAGLLSGVLDDDGVSRVWEGATAGTLIGLGVGALSGFLVSTWSPETGYDAPLPGYVGAGAALPLVSWTWRF